MKVNLITIVSNKKAGRKKYNACFRLYKVQELEWYIYGILEIRTVVALGQNNKWRE